MQVTEISIADHLCIGIATCNRWDDLRDTLQALQDYGLRDVETVIIDDNSKLPCPAELVRDFPKVRFLRDEVSRGSVTQRNRLARELTKDLWLQIDDDSNPVEGSVLEAVRYLLEHPTVACLALNLIEKKTVPPIPLDQPPFQVQRYTGCAVMLNRKIFLKIGGYRDSIIHMGEEGELCARALGAGHPTIYFPSLLVRHRRSAANRNTKRISYFQGRNRWLLVWWNVPMPFVFKKLLVSLPGTLAIVPRQDYPAAIRGFMVGIFHGLRTWQLRQPMERGIYQKWQALPWKSAD